MYTPRKGLQKWDVTGVAAGRGHHVVVGMAFFLVVAMLVTGAVKHESRGRIPTHESACRFVHLEAQADSAVSDPALVGLRRRGDRDRPCRQQEQQYAMVKHHQHDTPVK